MNVLLETVSGQEVCPWHFRSDCLSSLLVCLGRGADAGQLPQTPVDAVAPQDPLFHAPLARGIELVFADQYEASLALFDSLQAAHPEHP